MVTAHALHTKWNRAGFISVGVEIGERAGLRVRVTPYCCCLLPSPLQTDTFCCLASLVARLLERALPARIVDVNWPSQANEQREREDSQVGGGDKNEAEIDRCRFRFGSACLSIPRRRRVLSCRSRVEWFELRRQCIEGERGREERR